VRSSGSGSNCSSVLHRDLFPGSQPELGCGEAKQERDKLSRALYWQSLLAPLAATSSGQLCDQRVTVPLF